MLGAAQERWLREGIAAVPGRWNLLAQQTLMTRAILQPGRRRFSTDAWDGYPAARRRLLRAIREANARSCIVLSGDAHRAVVADLKVSFDRPDARVIATELCGPSLTSLGVSQRRTDALNRANPNIHFAESAHRGYFLLELTPEACVGRLRMLDDATDPSSGVSTMARFRVGAGRPGAVRQ